MSEHREIKVPPLGESVSEATVARWLKQAGDAVKADELLVELETDKVTLEVTAPASGVLYEVLKPEGSQVEAGQILGKVAAGAVAAEPMKSAVIQEAPEPKEDTEFFGIAPGVEEALAPSVRKMVAEHHVNPADIQGTGKDGRVTKGDVIHHLHMPKEAAVTESIVREEIKQPHSQPRILQSSVSDRREERVRMTRLRQRIAQRLKHAQNTAAILTTFNEIDMSAVFELRKKYKDGFEKKHGIRLGFMSFFVKAAIQALKEIPVVNAEIEGEDVIYKNYYDIGVAVSAPQGLVVPVIRNADQLSFAELEKEIAHLGQKARDGKLSIEEMTGGTFTISNGGVFGSLMATPILNPPQTGILGMHKIQERPVAIDGKIEIRPMMYVALSYDHRLIDGRESVTFLVRVKENVENPERLLLDL
jgi:2-oxoglutarate dehydrogenase E2 component (dihydrolipoamide succinyltransferase)